MTQYRMAIGVLLIVFSLALAGGWLRHIPGTFLHYLGWRMTSGVRVKQGNISYNGARIHFVVYGEGKPILLLHGGLSNRLSWFSQIPWLVEAGRQLVLIDTRGHGESTIGRTRLSYRLFAEDAIQVLDHLGIQQTDIIGWSDGGIVALFLGRDWPQRVGKIIAISANFDLTGLTQEANTVLHIKDRGYLSRIWTWVRGWWSGAGENFVELEKKIQRLWRTEPNLKKNDLQSITVPVLVVVGEKDLITLEHSAKLAHELANGRLAVIPGAGHSAPVTHAKEVDGLVADFLGLNVLH